MQDYLYQLRQQINNHFEMNELEDLAFALHLDWDNIAGATKKDKARHFLLQIQKNNRLPDLIYQLHRERPNIEWFDPPQNPSNHSPQPTPRDFSLPHPRMNMETEIQCIEQILTNQDLKTRLITINGPSGSGKTWLITEYTKLCQQYNHQMMVIDLKSEASISIEQCLQATVLTIGSNHFTQYNQFLFKGKPDPFTRTKEEEWQNNLTTMFFQDLYKQPHLPCLILLFDHFESKRGDQSFLRWLKNTLLPGIFSQQTLKIIIAGQDDLQYNRHQQYHQPFHLTGLPLECYYQFAEACNIIIEPHILNSLHQFAQGFPKLFVDYVHGQLRGAQ